MNPTTYIETLTAAIADQQRHLRALLKAQLEAERGNVPVRVNDGWEMLSSDGTQSYIIDQDTGCNCKAGSNHRLCKHMAAMQIAEAVEAAEIVDAARELNEFTAEELEAMDLDEFMDKRLHCEKAA